MKKIVLRTFRDFVEIYWFFLLTIIVLAVFVLWITTTAHSIGIIVPVGMLSSPWYFKNRRKRAMRPRTFILHSYVRRALHIMMMESIFNRNNIIPLGMLKENGITKGQLTYTTTVLQEEGVVERYNARNIKFDLEKAKDMEKSAVFKGGATWM